MVPFSLKETLLQGQPISTCSKTDSLLYCKQLRMTSFFDKMEHRPHWHLGVRAYLNENVPQQWIGRRGVKDLALCARPAKSLDLTVCDILKTKFMFLHFQRISMT